MKNPTIALLASLCLLVACYGPAEEVDPRAEDSETMDPANSNNGESETTDPKICNLNAAGFCIFSGSPHETGLGPATNNVVDRNGNFLFLIGEAAAANAAGEILQARGTPAADGDDLIQHSQDNMTDVEKAFHKVMDII